MRDRAGAVLTAGLFLGWLSDTLAYNIFDIHVCFIPTYLVLGLWVSSGFGALQETVERLAGDLPGTLRGVALLALAALLLSPFAGTGETYAEVDRSEDREGRQIIEAVAENPQPGATVLHNRSSLWYMVLVEERRRDLTLLDPFHPEEITTHDLGWPEYIDPRGPDDRYGTEDTSGVEAAQRAVERTSLHTRPGERQRLRPSEHRLQDSPGREGYPLRAGAPGVPGEDHSSLRTAARSRHLNVLRLASFERPGAATLQGHRAR